MKIYTQKSVTSAKSTDERADTDQCMTGVGLSELLINIIFPPGSGGASARTKDGPCLNVRRM